MQPLISGGCISCIKTFSFGVKIGLDVILHQQIKKTDAND